MPVTVGQRSTSLLALALRPNDHVLVRCDCGTEKEIWRSSFGKVRSCGCRRSELGSLAHRTHGATDTPTWRTWQAMRRRCTDPKSRDFHFYGGRGITVCARWANSFENFHLDMGTRPLGTSIDRIDNTKGYEPGNCRWVTPLDQARNRRRTLTAIINGQLKTLSEWADDSGVPLATLRWRVKHDPAGADLLRKPRWSTSPRRAEGATP